MASDDSNREERVNRLPGLTAAVTIVVSGLIGVASPPAVAATTTPSGIDATGQTDDTAALQSLINGLPDDSTLTFLPGGKYRIEGTLHVVDKHNLTIDGNGALFFATTTGDRTRSQWSFEGGSDIVVRNVVVKGANPNAGTGESAYVAALEAQHAFNIWSTDGIELDHVTATDVYGDFVYIGLQAGGLARNVYIHDSTFARNGRQGISITGADGVRIIHNTISDTRRATFDLEPNDPSWGAFNVDIEDNTIGPGRLNLIAAAGDGPEANIVFSHNTINRPFEVQVGDTSGGRRGPYTITDNTATVWWGGPAGLAALYFENVDGLTVTGNVIPLQPDRGDYAVTAIDSCAVTLTNNAITNAVSPYSVTPGPACASTPKQVATSSTNTAPMSPPRSTTPATPTQKSTSPVSPTDPAPKATTSTEQTTPSAASQATPKSTGERAPVTSAGAVVHGNGGPNTPKVITHSPASNAGVSLPQNAKLDEERTAATTTAAWDSHMWQRGLYTAVAGLVLLLSWLRISKRGIPGRRRRASVRTTPRHPGLTTTVWGSSEDFPQRHVR